MGIPMEQTTTVAAWRLVDPLQSGGKEHLRTPDLKKLALPSGAPGFLKLTSTMSSSQTETDSLDQKIEAHALKEDYSNVDIYTFHEKRAGRLVLDPMEARAEFGEAFASRLKTTKDGSKILWPQPTDDPEDPQNWSDRQKGLQLFIITLSAIVPDFDSGIGIASVFPLAKQFDTNTGHINNLTSNWSIFLIGWGGIFFVMFMRRYGRLPVLFWTQLLALGFLVGTTFAPTLPIFAGMRCLTAFFGTCPQVTGLFTITDMFPFHLQSRKINIWTMGVILAPHLSPFVFGFLVARASWRWAFGIGCLYGLVVLLLIVFFMKESYYNRHLSAEERRHPTGFLYRFKTLIGITGYKMPGERPSWWVVFIAPFQVIWRPHMLSVLLFEAMVFGFAIGVNVTNTVFLQSPPPIGFGLSPTITSGIYATPVIAVFLGQFVGHYLNDWVMNFCTRRNNGVFEAEFRLWSCYIGVILYVVGMVILGVSLQEHLSKVAIIFGWAISQVATLVTTVAVYSYCSDCFPKQQGEISGLLNLVRILGGFSVAYYQVPWATKHGALQTLGCEAAIVAGLCILILPVIQWKGRALRERFSIQ